MGTITQEEESVMADQKIEVSSPVKIVSDSHARVAFELMEKIDNYTGEPNVRKDKNYWLKLYNQCYRATNGVAVERILQSE